MESRVGERGQVTIPKPLRDSLGIRPGQVVHFTEERGRLVMRKAMPVDPVEAVYGILELEGSTDEAIRRLRGEPDAV
jgi:antitoxin PrlF